MKHHQIIETILIEKENICTRAQGAFSHFFLSSVSFIHFCSHSGSVVHSLSPFIHFPLHFSSVAMTCVPLFFLLIYIPIAFYRLDISNMRRQYYLLIHNRINAFIFWFPIDTVIKWHTNLHLYIVSPFESIRNIYIFPRMIYSGSLCFRTRVR